MKARLPYPKPGWPVLLLLGTALGGLESGPATSTATDADPYRQSIEAWRTERVGRLTSESGWLTISGLYWLEPGPNRFGSGPENTISLPSGSAPAVAGVLILTEGPGEAEIEARVEPGVEVTLEGEPFENGVLRSDAGGSPDRLRLGRVELWVIERGGRHGVRVRDPDSELLADFGGVEFFPVDSTYRVAAHLPSFEELEPLPLPNVLGHTDTVLTPGPVSFDLMGRTLSLFPIMDGPSDSTVFVVFGDSTNGDETYGGGRFLVGSIDEGGKVVLDFNKAYNPPCAFNPYTTCPLPPEGNVLATPIRAGEKVYRGTH